MISWGARVPVWVLIHSTDTWNAVKSPRVFVSNQEMLSIRCTQHLIKFNTKGFSDNISELSAKNYLDAKSIILTYLCDHWYKWDRLFTYLRLPKETSGKQQIPHYIINSNNINEPHFVVHPLTLTLLYNNLRVIDQFIDYWLEIYDQ